MRTIVLLPGIMGSELVLGREQIWPPTPRELVFGYGRIAKLASLQARVGDLVRSVPCYPIYQSLVDQLKAWGFDESASGGASGRLRPWPYDWRVDIRTTAAKLAQDLQALSSEDPSAEITLLAHSMGGLVSRFALEVAEASAPSAWRASVRQLITMGTPHRGAPLALVYALGQSGVLGISAPDVRTLSANPRFPSTYQLIPAADAFGFWSRQGGPVPLQAVDVLERSVAQGLGLELSNVQAAQGFHQALASGTRPPGCRYFSFVGRELETTVRGELSAGATLDAIADDDSGDGTVPVWSGTLADEQFQLDGDEHIRTFRNAKLIATLGELLGVPRAQLRATAPALAPLSVSLPRHVFSSGEIVRASVRSHAAALPEVALVIRPLDESGRPSGAAVSTVSLGALTANAAVRVQVALPASPGLYSITPRSGAPGLEGEPKQFAVQR
ncbi:MAG TPA: hypothetical protein VEI82_08405 [Myxococcota bacterium]|nr:hypothetical protein [Myxococcota bacterium]